MDQPFTTDYVQLLDSENQPSENFTLVVETKHALDNGVFIISNLDGEDFAVIRCEELDTNVSGLYPRKGWQQVVLQTNTAPASY